MGAANSVIENNRYDFSDSTDVNEDALRDAMITVQQLKDQEQTAGACTAGDLGVIHLL